MLELNALFKILDGIAPFSLSRKAIEKGDYDNSGIIIDSGKVVEKILFSLDLSLAAFKRAKRLGCDTVVTHHPAIYYSVKSLGVTDGVTAAVLKAAGAEMNVISAHLNLDLSESGTDACLSQALGATDYKILEYLDEKHGYGREFSTGDVTFGEFVKSAEKALGTKRAVCYGSAGTKIKKAASFCGAGAAHAAKAVQDGATNADVIVTSDIPHHLVKELVEAGKCVLEITHYASENYGFYKFYETSAKKIGNNARAFYFSDKRFV